MKKLCALLLCTAVIFSLAACGGENNEASETITYTYEIAFLTASPDLSIDDGDRIETAWNGVRQFAEENGKTYKYYEPESADTKAQMQRIEDAVEEGAKYIVASGPEVGDCIAEAQKKYKDITFIYLDGILDDVADNCVTVEFDVLQAGFLAGYGAVLEGLDDLAYLASGKSEESVSYGYGFLQGANEAAMRFGRYAMINYDYGEEGADKETIRKTAQKWFDGGTDAIFTYGGDVYEAAKTEAEKAGKVVIASNASKDYSKTVITSARKCYEESVIEQLQKAYDGTFEGGKNVSMRAENNGIGLDMKRSKFQYFHQTQYDDIYKELAEDKLEVLSAKDEETIEDLVKAKWLYYIRINQE